MRDEILRNLESQLSKEEYEKLKSKKLHLGVFSEPYLSYMLEGTKVIESRFSKKKIVPYDQIDKETIVIVKKSSGGVVAYFTIKDVIFFDFSVDNIMEVKEKYNKELCVGEDFWEQKKDSNYATLIFIDELVKLEAFKIDKKGMQSWLIL